MVGRRHARLAVGAAILLSVAGCTASGTPGTTAAGGTAQASPPTTPSFVVDREIVLGCEDAGSGAEGPRSGKAGAADLRLGGATIENLLGSLPDVPRAADVGLAMPSALAGWRFRKSPVYLAAGTQAVTVRLTDGDGNGALAWVASGVWTSGGSPKLAEWLAASVTFEGCPDRPSVYFGGITAAAPGTCLALSLELTTGTEPRPRLQRLDGGPCG